MAATPPPASTHAPVPAPPPDVEKQLPLRDIPGGYGLPVLGAIKDRLDFFWFQGEKEYWASRRKKFKSTVFRTHVPPSPPAFAANRVIMLLDQKSFPVLFDMDKVEKKDVLLANYMPRTSFYGGIRPCVYLDPSEERHTKLKSFIMSVLKAKASRWIPETHRATMEIFASWEAKLAAKPEGFEISSETGQVALNVLIRTLFGADPSADGLTPTAFSAWLGPQLVPIASVGLPHLLEELILHNFRIPFLLVAIFYKRIESFCRKHGGELLDEAEKQFGIEKEDALHNIIFFTGFNAFGGLNILLPWIVSYVGRESEEVKAEMAREVREAVRAEGGTMSVGALRRMPLVRSAVFEVLRMEPPVPYQYGVAKVDMVIESHEARFEVKKGDVLGGCQPVAVRDPIIFGESAETFKVWRFVGEEGETMVKHVLWGNGPADGEPSVANKQCAANQLVPLLAQAFLASLFLRYDSFSALPPLVRGNSVTHTLASLTPRPAV
ncbi:hypothetical protein GOP47_0018104 [Adiantum capillus-veneris]|uniref:Uncharacterized protein n=1 Tax=Adiantum capillus-veneris TaxID=13818 RepID=A0A9D4UHU0_ADICA|nr:hypothetical protein GOP47_0018104 [Adiantum capillus-veneris]